jgi:hypothetical protein
MKGGASKDSSVAVGTSDAVALNGIVEAHGDSSKMGGGVADGGVAGLEKGERRISSSSSDPCNSSTLLRRFLALFAGGVFTSGGEGGGGVVGDGGAVFPCLVSSQAGEAVSDEGSSRRTRLPLASVRQRW